MNNYYRLNANMLWREQTVYSNNKSQMNNAFKCVCLLVVKTMLSISLESNAFKNYDFIIKNV